MTTMDTIRPGVLHACRRRLAALALFAAAGMAAGVAGAQRVDDPFEPVNRAVFEFNQEWDRLIGKPIAETYVAVVPSPVRTGVANFFNNVNDLFSGINNLLQGKPEAAGHDFGRVLLNTGFGLVGILDIASEAGIERHDEDFGQTFGWWGAPPGPYMVLPFLGPSSGRDVTGTVIRIVADPVYFSDTGARIGAILLGALKVRAELLGTESVIEQAALDKYTFVRRGYLQRRRYLIFDGNPPPEKDEE